MHPAELIWLIPGGLLLGAGLNRAADWLPRFAGRPPRRMRTVPGLRLVSLVLLRRPEARRQLAEGDRALAAGLAIEWTMTALLVLIALRFEGGLLQAAVAALAALMVLIALIDLKYRLVLNVILLPAAGLMLAGRLFLLDDGLISALLGGGLALALFLLARAVSRGSLGGGDIKLATFLGLLFGLPDVIWALLAAVLAGGIVAVYLLLFRRWRLDGRLAYAPFLCLGAIILLFVDPAAWF